MTKPQASLYDPSKTYEYNLRYGPFGGFAKDGKYRNNGEPQYDFFGTKVYSSFGIAAGPLPGAQFVAAAFHKGFDIVTFKSVRTRAYPCHPAPNIVPVALDELDPTNTDGLVKAIAHYRFPLTIANSYGIPAFEPKIWQPEIAKAFAAAGKGQAVLAAFQGTDRGTGRQAFIDDHVEGVRLLHEAGARIIEINLSCPNEGSAELLCFDPTATRAIIEKVRAAISGIQLIVKITYFTNDEQLRRFVQQVGPLVDGITAINTIGARVVTSDSEQAFPGSQARTKPGISGRAIRHLGLDMVRRLNRYREELGLGYKIVGVGGVQSPQDFHDYQKQGADSVMSVTGAMWNANLAAQIKAEGDVSQSKKQPEQMGEPQAWEATTAIDRVFDR